MGLLLISNEIRTEFYLAYKVAYEVKPWTMFTIYAPPASVHPESVLQFTRRSPARYYHYYLCISNLKSRF